MNINVHYCWWCGEWKLKEVITSIKLYPVSDCSAEEWIKQCGELLHYCEHCVHVTLQLAAPLHPLWTSQLRQTGNLCTNINTKQQTRMKNKWYIRKNIYSFIFFMDSVLLVNVGLSSIRISVICCLDPLWKLLFLSEETSNSSYPTN